MRKINTRHFRLATRTTSREINRQIVLNLIREHQPISRAELARRMDVPRGALTAIVRDLIERGDVFERGTAAVARGRRPTLLALRTHDRHVVAVDVRTHQTSVALADFDGRVVARESFDTPATADALVDLLEEQVRLMTQALAAEGTAEGLAVGLGLVVPGMVDRRSGRVIYAPRLGWRDVDLRDRVASRLGLPVYVESAPIACAMARLWLSPEQTRDVRSFAYVSVSDGVGVGLVIKGEVLRGEEHTAGEFGHVSLDPNGPLCACGKHGCWEAFACNAATVGRYADAVFGPRTAGAVPRRAPSRRSTLPIEEIVRRAREGEGAAVAALADTGRQIGRGLAAVVSAFNPGRIYIGGEITAAWDIIEQPMREALVAETLTDAGHATPIVPDRDPAEYRLQGAVALVAAPAFAAPDLG